MPVASKEDDPKTALTPEYLREKCRYVMRDMGVGYARLAGLREQHTGAGVKLLQNTYKHRLEACGIAEDSALQRFMLHQSLVAMVQANNYRCFTDESATWLIQTYLARDDLRLQKAAAHPKPVRRKKQKHGDGEQVRVLSADTKQRAKAELVIHVAKGDIISVHAEHGCRLAFKTMTLSDGG